MARIRNPHPGRQLSISLRFATFPPSPDGQIPLTCLQCRNPLDIHQPDAELPDRMLATCEACKAWHLLDRAPGAADVLVLLLPDVAPFREALGPRTPAPRRRTRPPRT
jgi:hypothetical protein